MRDAVRNAFVAYSKAFEGCTNFPYLDLKGLVTVGVGNLEEPLAAFQQLPFTRGVGGPACSLAEIQNGYWLLKHSTLNPRNGGGQYANVTTLRLSDEAVTDIVAKKLSQMETVLLSLLPEWPTFSSDAQLGALSMAWALGPYFPKKWPKFTAAARSGDWTTCAIQCQPSAAEMAVQNASFHSRVSSWILLFQNAAAVVAQQIDPNVLQYPLSVAA